VVAGWGWPQHVAWPTTAPASLSWPVPATPSAQSTQRQSVILPAYTAAKAALTSVSKNLSLLLAKDEILVNVLNTSGISLICPGPDCRTKWVRW
jgi:NAD(P)-dependent dehydrogenase (short-subunit alcohol dehydrogenase family)